jgi:hypothetical protein
VETLGAGIGCTPDPWGLVVTAARAAGKIYICYYVVVVGGGESIDYVSFESIDYVGGE